MIALNTNTLRTEWPAYVGQRIRIGGPVASRAPWSLGDSDGPRLAIVFIHWADRAPALDVGQLAVVEGELVQMPMGALVLRDSTLHSSGPGGWTWAETAAGEVAH